MCTVRVPQIHNLWKKIRAATTRQGRRGDASGVVGKSKKKNEELGLGRENSEVAGSRKRWQQDKSGDGGDWSGEGE